MAKDALIFFRLWLQVYAVIVVGVPAAASLTGIGRVGCNPRHAFLEVKPFAMNGFNFQVNRGSDCEFLPVGQKKA